MRTQLDRRESGSSPRINCRRLQAIFEEDWALVQEAA
jgi:hypothetical protein